jgi:hypothetical protein
MRIRLLPALAMTCGVLALACERGETAENRTTERAMPREETSALNVASVDLGRSLNEDKSVRDGTDSFRRNDTIFAAIKTSGAGQGTLGVRWMFQDGQVVDQSTQAISPTTDTWTEFHIAKPDGWPVGKYRLEVTLNGAVVETKEFDVK